MPNATVRANARALPEISVRRASPAKADVAPPFGARAETVSIAGEYRPPRCPEALLGRCTANG